MILPWIATIIINIALRVVAYLISPKPKQPKPAAVQDGQYPEASAGKPIPVVFGTMRLSAPNVLWSGDKETRSFQIKA